MPTTPGRERQHEPPALAQVAEVELASRLQAHHEEEQRHQAAADPFPQVLAELGVADPQRHPRVPRRGVGGGGAALAQTSATTTAATSTTALAGLGADERPQRRGPAARPERAEPGVDHGKTVRPGFGRRQGRRG